MPRQAACGILLLGIATALTACSETTSSVASGIPGTSASAGAASSLARLELSYERPAVVGTPVRARATGLPPGRVVDLLWGTVSGGWVIEDYYHFRGKKYSETTLALGRFPVDPSGQLDASFEIPEDWGGVHEVVVMLDGRRVAGDGINVTQTFELSPAEGPVGTPIELKVTGLGWRTMESTWVVNWDNHAAGWVSAAGTRGTAVARFRAGGPPGDHVIKLYTGYQGQSYLNYEQSPVAHLPRPEFVFRTTAGATAPAVYAEAYPRQPVPETEVGVVGATLALSPTQGPVGTNAILRGTGFTPGAALQLIWETSVGSRVSGDGFAPVERPIGETRVTSDGRIEATVNVPRDLGGLHGLVLRGGSTDVARTFFVIETSIVGMMPTSGPAGTPVTIQLEGVGWTEYDNIYVATYDNAYMGYACGFNSQGDVTINFTATGGPGPHLIDFYPGIYQGPPTEAQQLYRLPQLTYADDHPGNKIPALRFMFEVTPSTTRTPTRTLTNH